MGGNLTNSRFEELMSARDIAARVRQITGIDVTEDGDFGLAKMADFTTFRETWVADDEFTIVRDRVDFDHEVGEVELQMEVGGLSEAEKKRVMGNMDDRIGAFMEKYAWVFASGKPKGKLVAYFEAKAAQQRMKNQASM